ncbi:MAG: hypothetical protein J6X60_01260, partial [Ruminiclostridium sp.]|nr:hypothetical protein [Ruminiclostridium sp.]
MVKSYTFADLQKVTEWGVKSGVSDDGVLDLTFEGQYQSSFYAIPADINPAAIDKVVFDVKSGNAGDFAYKLHTQADFDSDNKGGTPVSYGNPEIKATDKDVKYFSLMSLNDGGSLSVSKVTFYLKEVEAAPAGGSQEKTFTFSDLEKVTEWGVTSNVSADGVLDIAFEGQYKSSFYKIPDGIKGSSIEKAVFNVTSGNAGDIAYKLHTQADFDSDNKGGTPVSYGNPQVVATGEDVVYLSVMSLNEGSTKVAISDVTFTVNTGASTRGVEQDVPNLKDKFADDLGDDFITGISIVQSEINDENLMGLVKKHFNAVTLGNELKPDANFGYSNDVCP